MDLVLVNCLRGLSLPRNSVVKLSDNPDMAMDVKQQNNNATKLSHGKLHVNVDALANLKKKHCVHNNVISVGLCPMDGLPRNSEAHCHTKGHSKIML